MAFNTAAYTGGFTFANATTKYAKTPKYYTSYPNAAQASGGFSDANMKSYRAMIDKGISPVISLSWKTGPFTRAQVRDGKADALVKTVVGKLKELSDYAASKNNGTKVYFGDEHEAIIKINQDKYTFTGYGSASKPTLAESAAAWNRVMGMVQGTAPRVVRVYWYGGFARDDGDLKYGDALKPDLIQMATFDPYHWMSRSSSATAASIWGTAVNKLKARSWMKNSTGGLKRWGLTEWGTEDSHGDAQRARFVRDASAWLESQGALFAIYFDRPGLNGNNFELRSGTNAYSAYREIMTRKG